MNKTSWKAITCFLPILVLLDCAWARPDLAANEIIGAYKFLNSNNKSGMPCVTHGDLRADITNWRKNEKVQIQNCLSRLTLTCPELLLAAANRRDLRLIRVSDFHSSEQITTQRQSSHRTAILAMSREGAIYFTDRFFSKPDSTVRRNFIHELAHCADIGSLVAYSPQWIECRAGYCLSNRSDDALHEDLAELFASYVERPKSLYYRKFKIVIAPLLLSNSDKRILFNQAMIDGIIQLKRCKNYDQAILYFSEAVRQVPLAPLPHLSLAFCYSNKKDWALANRESMLAYSLFHQLHVPSNDRAYAKSSCMYARKLIQVDHDFKTAKEILAKLLETNPNNKEAMNLFQECR